MGQPAVSFGHARRTFSHDRTQKVPSCTHQESHMDKALLTEDIEAASQEIRVAEQELGDIVRRIPVAPRASKVEVSEAVRTASARLNAARTNLIRLNARLVESEASETIGKLEEAKASLVEAELHLDRVVRGMAVDTGAEKSWVSQEVRDAFSNLESAKKNLADLQALAADGQ